ncbi:MAG TPA: hypothetical protein VKA95_13375 [Nitrososphaeraceae archaeon]|nr:hypothetical protein [Nitrososphaeraceae archaeon]
MLRMIVKLTKTNFESFIVIGVLIMAIALIGSSFPNLVDVQWDKVFAQASNDATTTNLQFSYTKLGVLNGAYQRISYNSETRTLGLSNTSASSTISETGKILSSQQASQSQSNRQLSETDERNLLDTITRNGFFEANSVYPPITTANQKDYLLHVLAVSVNGKMHTVLWTDSSNNVPAGISSVAQTIENMAFNNE